MKNRIFTLQLTEMWWKQSGCFSLPQHQLNSALHDSAEWVWIGLSCFSCSFLLPLLSPRGLPSLLHHVPTGLFWPITVSEYEYSLCDFLLILHTFKYKCMHVGLKELKSSLCSTLWKIFTRSPIPYNQIGKLVNSPLFPYK